MSLPAPTAEYMLHQPPLRLIQRLLRVDEAYAEAETVLADDQVGIGPNGRIEAAALVELVAQAYAAAQGYRDQQAGKSAGMGYLVGASDFQIASTPAAGQSLRIKVTSTRSFADFYMVDGEVLAGTEVVAHGTLKVWVQPENK